MTWKGLSELNAIIRDIISFVNLNACCWTSDGRFGSSQWALYCLLQWQCMLHCVLQCALQCVWDHVGFSVCCDTNQRPVKCCSVCGSACCSVFQRALGHETKTCHLLQCVFGACCSGIECVLQHEPKTCNVLQCVLQGLLQCVSAWVCIVIRNKDLPFVAACVAAAVLVVVCLSVYCDPKQRSAMCCCSVCCSTCCSVFQCVFRHETKTCSERDLTWGVCALSASSVCVAVFLAICVAVRIAVRVAVRFTGRDAVCVALSHLKSLLHCMLQCVLQCVFHCVLQCVL